MRLAVRHGGLVLGLVVATGLQVLLSAMIEGRQTGAGDDFTASAGQSSGMPTLAGLRLLAMGDDQFAYRLGSLNLQEFGDGGGTITPLADYDYAALVRWMRLLDRLDGQADLVPALAAYYFALTTDPDQLRLILNYLQGSALSAPRDRWRYLVQAVYIARHRLGDRQLALEAATRLAALESDNIPLWARQLPAFVMAEVGADEAARDIMAAILASDADIAPGEARLMRDFLEQRRGGGWFRPLH